MAIHHPIIHKEMLAELCVKTLGFPEEVVQHVLSEIEKIEKSRAFSEIPYLMEGKPYPHRMADL